MADSFQCGTVSARADHLLSRLRRLLPGFGRIAVTRTSYSLFAPGDFLAYNDQRPRTEIKEICGVEVSRTYHAYPTNALGQAQEIEERAAFPGAPYGHGVKRGRIGTNGCAEKVHGRVAHATKMRCGTGDSPVLGCKFMSDVCFADFFSATRCPNMIIIPRAAKKEYF